MKHILRIILPQRPTQALRKEMKFLNFEEKVHMFLHKTHVHLYFRPFFVPSYPGVELETKCHPWDFSPILNVIVTLLLPDDSHSLPLSHP